MRARGPRRSNASFNALVIEGKKLFRAVIKTELRLFRARDRILILAWQFGKSLAQLKEEAGHGNWYIWLPANFPELGASEITRLNNAKRYMKFWKENQSAQIRGIPNDLKAEELFSADSIRKFMWTYMPVKERPRLLAASSSGADTGLNQLRRVVKHFWKWERELQLGRVPMPRTDQFRREMELVLRRVIELGGTDWYLQALNETPNFGLTTCYFVSLIFISFIVVLP